MWRSRPRIASTKAARLWHIGADANLRHPVALLFRSDPSAQGPHHGAPGRVRSGTRDDLDRALRATSTPIAGGQRRDCDAGRPRRNEKASVGRQEAAAHAPTRSSDRSQQGGHQHWRDAADRKGSLALSTRGARSFPNSRRQPVRKERCRAPCRTRPITVRDLLTHTRISYDGASCCARRAKGWGRPLRRLYTAQRRNRLRHDGGLGSRTVVTQPGAAWCWLQHRRTGCLVEKHRGCRPSRHRDRIRKLRRGHALMSCRLLSA